MMRKLWIVIAILYMVAMFALKANAQQQPSSGNSKGHGVGEQLQQEISALEQQAKPLRTQLEQIEAQAKPIREQLRPIQEKIKSDREKLRHLREERREERREEMQQKSKQQQAPIVPQHK